MTAPTQSTVEAFLSAFAGEVARKTAECLAETLPAPERLLTVEQAAERLNVTPRTVRNLVTGQKGEPPRLASVSVAEGARRIENGEVDRYIASRRVARRPASGEDRGPN